jgi:hypothetical protein
MRSFPVEWLPGCPRCSATLSFDSAPGAPSWRCAAGHVYRSTRELVAALRAQGWQPRLTRAGPGAQPA